MFAEIYFEKPSLRTFKVSVEGKVIKTSLDLVAEVGFDNAYRVSTVVQVVDGKIDIKLDSLIENAMISGIEVISGGNAPAPVPAPAPAPSPVLVSHFYPSLRQIAFST
jgi:Malectin domain